MVKKNDSSIVRYLRTNEEKSFRHAVAYQKDGSTIIGAFWGYAGGGVFDGGYFRIDDNGNVQTLGFDDIEMDEQAVGLDQCMKEVANMYANDEDDSDRPELTPAGEKLLSKAVKEDNGDLIFMDTDFDTDDLAQLSDEWRIFLRFEW